MNCLQNNSHLAAVETYEELIEIGQLIHETGEIKYTAIVDINTVTVPFTCCKPLNETIFCD